MKVTVFGLGHVGLVQSVVFAECGHDVLCMDVDAYKIENIKRGILPFYELGLDSLLKKNYRQGRLQFTTNEKQAVEYSTIQCITVNTPLSSNDDSIDLRHVMSVVYNIVRYMCTYKIILIKSTVPVGTTHNIRTIIFKKLQLYNKNLTYNVIFNPEFLREGSAIANCMYPDRIILGLDGDDCESDVMDLLYELYDSFNHNENCILFMDTRSAELTKYAANCMLATKISFINEIANLSEKFGADVDNVRRGIASDSRIGNFFINPGCGYGGSCFSKDIKALAYYASKFNYYPTLLKAVETVNNYQKNKLLLLIRHHFGNDLDSKIFALWGLSFKPHTDDIRFASSCVLIEALLSFGAKIQAYDPKAMHITRDFYKESDGLQLMATKEAVLYNADALVICTEWEDFHEPDFNLIKITLRQPVIFDGRNLYDPKYLYNFGFIYYAFGRGASCCSLIT